MTTQDLTFILGGILVLVSILGGGFEVRELKVPKVNGFTRLIAAVAGTVFIWVALAVIPEKTLPVSGISPNPSPPPAFQKPGSGQPDNYPVTDQLGWKYEGKYKAYSAVLPKAWKLAEMEYWTQDKQAYKIVAMFAPASAARAEVNGYLSEGVRIEITMPPEGRVLTLGTTAEFAPEYAKKVTEGNEGFIQTYSADTKAGQEAVKVFEFVGQNANIPEPEKGRHYVLAKQQCWMTIECVAPASRFNDYEVLFDRFFESFEFKGCPAWKSQ